ncbi:MAG: T9SS type A sorting domain-containing protein [Bacteroidales bacterium]|nr:T9SS type A sorting domain-containing protein [Bacteroidales bacterium]
MKKRLLPLSMLLITMVLAQAGHAANDAGTEGKYVPRSKSEATVSSYMKSIRTNQETGLIDPALLIKAQKAAQKTVRDGAEWTVVGPDNYGALTRAMLYDETDQTNNTLIIGTMGGRVFKSVNGGITMKEMQGNLNALISDMIQVDGVLYVATGDGRNSQMTNPLSDYGYETGFVGNGIWKINSQSPNAEQIASTNPDADNGWAFVNELAESGTSLNRIFAATNGGLRYTTNNGDSWTTLIEGNATSVKMNGFGAGLAVVDADVYRINMNGEEVTKTLLTGEGEGMLPAGDEIKVVAMSPSDQNYMYVGYIIPGTNEYLTGNIYFSNDGGNTWRVALTATSGYNLFGARSYIDNAMEVFPNNPQKLLVGGKNVWVLEYATGSNPNNGVYIPTRISDGETNELEQLIGGSFDYVHVGIQKFLFNPDNSNIFFVGTEGGVFKGSFSQGKYKFSNCNRYFATEDEHTSVARMFGVGVGGGINRTIGGCLDHGTIFMEGNDSINNVTTGEAIFPNYDPTTGAATVNGHYIFKEAYAGGQCAISTIDPNIMFVTATGAMKRMKDGSEVDATPLYRTNSSGFDYDMSNFYSDDSGLSNVIMNTKVFRTPFAMYENYNDVYSINTTVYAAIDSVAFRENDTIVLPNPIHRAGDIVDVHSNISGFPFKYALPCDVNKGDSIFDIQDIISTTMVCGVENNIYMTRNAHYFDQVSEWWRIGEINGIPSAVAISSDGDIAFVGTTTGELYRISNLKVAVTAELATIDSTGCITVFDPLNNSLFKDRTITAISAVNGKVLVSTGNYGNNDYVFLSEDNGESFVSKQGSLPKAPVYSCLIEKTSGDLVVGTEHGIYIKAENGDWEHSGNIIIPVTDLKQAAYGNRESQEVLFGYDVKFVNGKNYYTPINEQYAGIENEGIIYAATYGNGIIKNEAYKAKDILSLDENSLNTNTVIQMSVYPNPVVGTAQLRFELTESANVRYDVYDLAGRVVASRNLGNYGQGSHDVTFNANNLTAGSYIVRIQAGDKTQSTKIMVF